MCFYQSPKTVEMRFLRPSYNFNKIVNWIFIFSAILQYSIDFAKKNKALSDKAIYDLLHKTFIGDLSDFHKIISAVYSKEITEELMEININLEKLFEGGHPLTSN